MTVLGQLALWLTLLLAIWGSVIGFVGGHTAQLDLRESAKRAVYGQFALASVASLSLLVALIGRDFNVAYVASYTSRDLPMVYTISAFWGGQNGSLLFWLLVLTGFSAAAQWLTPHRYRDLMPYVGAVTSMVALFFVATTVFAGNPFERLPFTPPDGRGLNPQLQNPGMAIHPPMLYLGYISITIPFAFAVAALMTKKLDTAWIHAIRKWTLLSWTFLSIGITLGMWWAYEELGWGGYWAWDPVENASFLPWLTMTAFLHSVMVQEKRGMLKKWNVVLVMLSFVLSIFGTFLTRSGVISSVHSFTQSPVGGYFLWFLVAMIAALTWLLVTRLPMLETETTLENMLSREASFLFNNLLLVGMAFSILWGTMFPIISELVQGTQVTVGPPFFNRVNFPIGVALLALTGIGPLIAWRKSTPKNLRRHFVIPLVVAGSIAAIVLAIGSIDFYAGVTWVLSGFVLAGIIQEFYRGAGARHRLHGESYVTAVMRLISRNRRRYGGYIVHIGIVIYFIGFTGMAFQKQVEANLKPGEQVSLQSAFGHEYTFTHVGVGQHNAVNRIVTTATVQLSKDGSPDGLMQSEKRQYFVCSVAQAPCPTQLRRPTELSTEAGIRSGLREDVYIVFAGTVGGTEEAVYRFTLTPLVWWVWYGGVVLVLGGVIVMWPGTGPTQMATRKTPGYQVALAKETVTS